MSQNQSSTLIFAAVALFVWLIKPSPLLDAKGLIATVENAPHYAATHPNSVAVTYEPHFGAKPLGAYSVQIALQSETADKKGALIDRAKELAASLGANQISITFFGQAGPSYLLRGMAFAQTMK